MPPRAGAHEEKGEGKVEVEDESDEELQGSERLAAEGRRDLAEGAPAGRGVSMRAVPSRKHQTATRRRS